LGRQELLAEILEDNPDALFTRENLDRDRVKLSKELIDNIESVCVAIDPAVTSDEDSADTGIVAAGMTTSEEDNLEHYYILTDRTCHKKPSGWAKDAVRLYDEWDANAVVGEVNNGGDMIEHTIRTINWAEGEEYVKGEDVYYESVRATKGKLLRAEPISALSEQGRLHIVGNMPELEDQMCTWSASLGEKSPDRYDAMVWAVTWLQKNAPGSVRFL
jgi:phage terminase large subunit-like protein